MRYSWDTPNSAHPCAGSGGDVLSPHGPSDQHHPHSPQRRSSYSSICFKWHLLQLLDLNLSRSWRYFAKYQLDHRNQLNLKDW